MFKFLRRLMQGGLSLYAPRPVGSVWTHHGQPYRSAGDYERDQLARLRDRWGAAPLLEDEQGRRWRGHLVLAIHWTPLDHDRGADA